MTELNRLRWKCRRGMLELDLVLERFVTTEYPSLPAEAQTAFASLLECGDAELWAMITGDQPCDTPAFQPLIERLRTC